MQKQYENLKIAIQDKLIQNQIALVNIHIKSTYKNTILTLVQKISSKTEKQYKTILQLSTKRFLTKSKKQNQMLALSKIQFLINQKFLTYDKIFFRVYFSGVSNGLKLLKKLPRKFKLIALINETPTPFNGCRSKKLKRR